MRAYLIYTPQEGEKNRQFIQMFQEEGKRRGISFSYVPLGEYQKREPVDVVLNRTRLPEVSQWFEERGCTVLHDSTIVEVANNKWKTLVYLLQVLEWGDIAGGLRDQWLPDTLHLPAEGRVEGFADDRQYPCIVWKNGREVLGQETLSAFLARHPFCVIKSVSGHGGRQVERAVSREEIADFAGRFPREDVMLQKEIACDSRDVRMYILGNEIYQGVLRQGCHDFRSNFSLGGEVQAYAPTAEQRALLQRVLQGFGNYRLGMAGMDFLLGEDGRFYFNELEEMAGCRMLYQATDMHIVRDYVEWIVNLIGQSQSYQ